MSLDFPLSPNDQDVFNANAINVVYVYNATKDVWLASSNATVGNISILTSTTDLPEGDNLYYTNARARSAFTAGAGITITNGEIASSAVASVTSLNGEVGDVVLTTANIAESGNLYFTNSRAVSAFSAGSGITLFANGQLNAACVIANVTINGANVPSVFSNEKNELFISDNEFLINRLMDFDDVGNVIIANPSGTIATKRFIGSFSRADAADTSGVLYPFDYNFSSSVTTADTLLVSKLSTEMNTGLNTNGRFALKTAYGNLNAGFGFVVGTAKDVTNFALGNVAGVNYSDNTAAVVMGFMDGPRVMAQNYYVSDDSDSPPTQVITCIGNVTELNSSLVVRRPLYYTSNVFSFGLTSRLHSVVFDVSDTCTVTFPSDADKLAGGLEINFKTITSNPVVSGSSNVVPIDGTSPGTAILPGVAGSWARIVFDGTNWVIMASG